MIAPPEPLPRLLAFPPLLYVTAFALGLALHAVMPLQALPPVIARTGGVLLLTASAALLVWARLTLHRARTTWVPGGSTVALALGGPYTLSRNPMCLGMAGLHLGLGLLLNAVAPLLLFVPVFLLVERRVIRWEEQNLAAKFGAPYLEYLGRVPRWL